MVRVRQKLSALKVERLKTPGLYADGGGLYLQVTSDSAKSWIYRFHMPGHVSRSGHPRTREMGLGRFPDITLADARVTAEACRIQVAKGIDPIKAREEARQREKLEATKAITFAECAAAYIEAHKAGWRNAKHAKQWENTLETYANPVIGALSVRSVDTGHMMRILEPIWTKKPETAGRVRGRIEAVLDWATVRQYRQGDNPARWRGHLENLLPPRSKVRRVVHHPALPYDEMGVFMAELSDREGIAAQALAFTILTAARTEEVAQAAWAEFDLKAATWTVPAGRIKGGREHRVPLSSAALAILKKRLEARRDEHGGHVFPGAKRKRPLSNAAMLELVKQMHSDRPEGWRDANGRRITVHGFRSTFRDWAAERTNFAREVAEMALAHAVSDEVEAAYRRGDLFQKRRQLMQAWERHCELRQRGGAVATLRGGA